MKYTQMLGNRHLTEFPDCKDAVVENSVRLIPGKLKKKERSTDRQLWEFDDGKR